MPASSVLITAWVRSAVVPVGGAFRALHIHELAAPVVHALLERAHLPISQVDALVMGNALGAGGNPARMVALASGLPDRCHALSVDTQCCSGLDAIAMGAAMIASGQAQVVIAGGAEAWSRAPIRQHRPLNAGEPAVPYDRPAFAPDPARDPDLLEAAAQFAQQRQYSRAQQNDYAHQSHLNALTHQHTLSQDIVPIEGVRDDAYPRALNATRLPRIPLASSATPVSSASSTPHAHAQMQAQAQAHTSTVDCGVSQLAVSVKADGAAFVLLMSQSACQRFAGKPRMRWLAHAAVGHAPEMPLLAAEAAAQEALRRAGIHHPSQLTAIELHDAFAAQGISFAQRWGLSPEQFNTHGGGLARGHPIGASGAIALVNLLTRMALLTQQDKPCEAGLVAIAAAGGLGSAALLQIEH